MSRYPGVMVLGRKIRLLLRVLSAHPIPHTLLCQIAGGRWFVDADVTADTWIFARHTSSNGRLLDHNHTALLYHMGITVFSSDGAVNKARLGRMVTRRRIGKRPARTTFPFDETEAPAFQPWRPFAGLRSHFNNDAARISCSLLTAYPLRPRR